MSAFFRLFSRFIHMYQFIPSYGWNYPAAAKSPQSCPTLCNPIDSSPLDSSVPGILQARTLEWVAISFSNAWKWKMKGKSLSRARLLATPWTAAHQAPPSMGLSRQEYRSGVPLPSPKLSYCMLYYTLFTHSSITEHLDSFYLWAIENSAAMKFCVQVLISVPVFNILVYLEVTWWIIW